MSSSSSSRSYTAAAEVPAVLSPDDLLTLATTRRIGAAAVKASLDLLIAAAADAAAAASETFDLDSPGLSPVTSAYAIDPILWPRLCAAAARNTVGINSIDATGMLLRKAIAEASRHAVILIPVPVVMATSGSDGSGGSGIASSGSHIGDSLHWLLLLVLPAERAIECYDSRRQHTDKTHGKGGDEGDGEDRCWRALRTVRTALVLRGLARYWNCSSSESSVAAAAAAAAVGGSAAIAAEATEPTGETTEEDEDLDERSVDGPWKLRVVPCAQQRQQRQRRSNAAVAAKSGLGRARIISDGSKGGAKNGTGDGRGGAFDDEDDVSGNASATYMLWFARCILLEDDARSLTQPPPPGFRRQIMRELFSFGRR
jgi:hypothetical protein